MTAVIRILGIDPGLRVTGFGMIEKSGNVLRYLTSGCIKTEADAELPVRLRTVLNGIRQVIEENHPSHVAVEKVFVNVNPQSTLCSDRPVGGDLRRGVPRFAGGGIYRPAGQAGSGGQRPRTQGTSSGYGGAPAQAPRRALGRRGGCACLCDLPRAWRNGFGIHCDSGLSRAPRQVDSLAVGMRTRVRCPDEPITVGDAIAEKKIR